MFNKFLQILKVAIAALISSIILILIMALLAFKLQLSDSQIVLCVVVIYAIGSFIAGFGLGKLKKEKRLLYGLAAGTTYFALIFIISVMNTGAIDDIALLLRNLLICACAGAIGGIIS